jgi:DNA-binding PadR family transcriptional regulator
MRGQLKILILNSIIEEPLSGADIAKKINQVYNWNPSPGSLYPQLEIIEKENLATTKIDKNKKIYKITTKGKQELKKLQKNKDTLITYIKKSHALMKEMYGIETNIDEEMLKTLKNQELPFKEIDKELTDLKKEMYRILSSKNFEKNKSEFKKTILKHTKELKKIK